MRHTAWVEVVFLSPWVDSSIRTPFGPWSGQVSRASETTLVLGVREVQTKDGTFKEIPEDDLAG